MIAAESAVLMSGFVVLAGLFGLLIGSFLNVVVYRVPLGMSLASPPSACPGCGEAIKPYDNIPVLSWLILGGRCRRCSTSISVRYPLVELGTGVFFVLVTLWFGTVRPVADSVQELVAGVLVLVAFLALAAVSVSLALIDLATHTLPNRIVLPMYPAAAMLLGAAAILDQDVGGIIRAGLGLAALWIFYLLLAILYPGGMGFGDVKLAGVLGLFLGYLGWGALLIGGFAAFLCGGVYAIVLLVTRKAKRTSGIPFGPWMLAGAWIGILWGNALWSSYLDLLGV